jgi:hypothetical protein
VSNVSTRPESPSQQLCPRTTALIHELAKFGYSAANDRCTSLCWELEGELHAAQYRGWHASAPTGHLCADCTMGGEACPDCYAAYWRQKNPNTTLVGSQDEHGEKP